MTVATVTVGGTVVTVEVTVDTVTVGETVVAVTVGVAGSVVGVTDTTVEVGVGPLTKTVRGRVVDCPSLWNAVTVIVYDPLAA